MQIVKSLDECVLDLLQRNIVRPLRWYEIRNELLLYEEIPLGVRENAEGFSVKLSRSLKRLQRDGIIKKQDLGHKNTIYSLTENYQENLLKKQHSSVSFAGSIFVGLYKLGDSYQKVKRKALKQWIEHFERELEPDLKKAFEEMKKKEVRK